MFVLLSVGQTVLTIVFSLVIFVVSTVILGYLKKRSSTSAAPVATSRGAAPNQATAPRRPTGSFLISPVPTSPLRINVTRFLEAKLSVHDKYFRGVACNTNALEHVFNQVKRRGLPHSVAKISQHFGESNSSYLRKQRPSHTTRRVCLSVGCGLASIASPTSDKKTEWQVTVDSKALALVRRLCQSCEVYLVFRLRSCDSGETSDSKTVYCTTYSNEDNDPSESWFQAQESAILQALVHSKVAYLGDGPAGTKTVKTPVSSATKHTSSLLSDPAEAKLASLESECKPTSLDANTLGVPAHRVIFCQSAIGKRAIYRQIEPSLIVEEDPEVCVQCVRYIQDVVCVGGEVRALSSSVTNEDAAQIIRANDVYTYFTGK